MDFQHVRAVEEVFPILERSHNQADFRPTGNHDDSRIVPARRKSISQEVVSNQRGDVAEIDE